MSPSLVTGITLGAGCPGKCEQNVKMDPTFGFAINFGGVPRGCVVRNTFLEWAEECDNSDETATPRRSQEPSSPSSRRARSCPAQPEQVHKQDSWSDYEELAPCATPQHRDRQFRGEDPTALGGGAAVQTTPPPVLLPGTERRGMAAPVVETLDSLDSSDDVGFNYRGVSNDSMWLQDTPTWRQGHSPAQMAGSGYGARVPADESRGNQKSLKGPARSNNRSSLVLRGLPFDVTQADVVAFIRQHGAEDALAPGEAVCLVTNPQGKPSGFAEVQLNKHANYGEIQDKLHMKRLGDRYIEVLPPFSRAKASPWKSPSTYRPDRGGSRWQEGGKHHSWRQM